MGRHAFAEGLLQFLGFLAWLAGATGLIAAAMLWSQDGQGLAATQLAIATVVGAAGLLAVTHVGRAVIDLAQTAGEGLHRLQAIETALARAPEPARAVATPPPRAVPPAPAAPAAPALLDERRWSYLKEADTEVAAAAARAAKLGPRWEAAMAERVLVLGTGYLSAIERALAEQAEVEAQGQTEEETSLAQLSEAARHEFLSYRATVEARNGVDPYTLKRVVSAEPYKGSWTAYVGGVKVALDDGRWMLLLNGKPRMFQRDPDLGP